MNLDQIAEGVRKSYTLGPMNKVMNEGKFFGEPVYVPYFWEKGLLGFHDGDHDKAGFRFVITKDDRDLFPEIPSRRRVIYIWENEQGFCESW